MTIRSVKIDIGTPQPIITAGADIAVTTVYLCNRSASPVTANVFLKGASDTTWDNMIYSNLTIAGYDTYIMDQERLLLSTGDSIMANVDVLSSNVVVATVTYTNI